MDTFFVAVFSLLSATSHAAPPVQAVELVELQRYAGKWYEIASLPMFFQRNCVADTTAEYTLLPDGSVGVNNRCRTKDGDIDSASGTASAVKDSGNAKLDMTFF